MVKNKLVLNSLDCYNRFGEPNIDFENKEMMLLVLPKWITSNIKALPKRIYCNKQIQIPLLVSFYNIIDRNLESEVISWDGCFSIRPKRGYSRAVKKALAAGNIKLAMSYMSFHSWGCAIDINALRNPLNHKPKMSKELVACFEDSGFIWGGNWSRPDGMHFQIKYFTE